MTPSSSTTWRAEAIACSSSLSSIRVVGAEVGAGTTVEVDAGGVLVGVGSSIARPDGEHPIIRTAMASRIHFIRI
jgi:hypothetical protein